MKLLLFLFFSSLFVSIKVNSGILYIESSDNYLGHLNGKVARDKLEIERSLNNSQLLYIRRDELDKNLERFYIKHSKLISGTADKIVVAVGNLDPKLDVILTLSILTDGSPAAVSIKQDSSSVRIDVLKEFDFLEVRVVRPVQIIFPKSFLGEFNLNVDIEG